MSDPRTDRLIATLSGVICVREAGPSPGLTLRGVSADEPPERLILSFIGTVGAELPARLDTARVLAMDAQCYRIESPPQEWIIRARALHVHRDAREAFFQAVPPRPAPAGKRLFWRVVLWVAGRRAGPRLLKALRRR